MAVTPGEQKPYPFEVELDRARGALPSRRTHEDAVAALSVLRTRLDVPEGVHLHPDLEHGLLRYCTDVVLNIGWYERARRREESRNTRMTALMVGLMLVALGLLFVSSLDSLRPKALVAPSGMLELTIFAGGALTVLQVIAVLGDGKARLTIFWKASADLKEALYTFERRWRSKCTFPSDDGGVVTAAPGFDDALEDVLRTARSITRAERLDFFATLRSPSDVVAVATAAADSLRGRRADAAMLATRRDDGVAEAQKALALARAAVAAAEFRGGASADPAEKPAADKAVLDARAEAVRAESVLRELSV